MDRVPVEVLEIILGFVPFDQLKNCVVVCKKWKFTVGCLRKFDCLVVYHDTLPVNQRFFHTNQLVSLQHCIKQEAFFRPSEMKRSIYRRFRRLYIYDHFNNFEHEMIPSPRRRLLCWMFSEPHKLNWLNHLEELHLWMVNLQKKQKLILPNLKTFKVLAVFKHTLTLDAPQLTNLSVFDFENLLLLHPQTIQKLEFKGELLFAGFNLESLVTLSDLKHLLITHLHGGSIDDQTKIDEIIKFLCNLKEIHVHYYSALTGFYGMLRRLKEQTNDQIQIYYDGFKMTFLINLFHNPRGPFYHPWVNSKDLDFYLINRSMTSETLPFKALMYQLVENCREPDFFTARRLIHLEYIVINAVRDERALGNWLKSLDTLIHILFQHPLSQEFYSNILPASCPDVEILRFEFKEELDFTFLLEFQYLFKVECYQLTYDLIEVLFTGLAYFKRLTVVGKSLKSTFLMSKRKTKSATMFKIEKLVVGKNIENFSSFQNFMERLKVLLAKPSVKRLKITRNVNKKRKLLSK